MTIVTLTISSLIFILILTMVFYSKKKLKQKETSIFSRVLLCTLIGILFVLYNYIILKLGISEDSFLYIFSTKLILFYYLVWVVFFYDYVCVISKSTSSNKIHYYLIALWFILIMVFPLTFKRVGDLIIPSGYIIKGVYTIIFGYIILGIIQMIKNFKKVSIKKYYPLLAFIIIGTIAMIIQIKYPNLLLEELLYSVVVYIIYFTIENPDLKMIEELSSLNNAAQQSNVSKSEFIMDVTNDILDKLDSVDNICENISNDNPSEYTKNEIINLKQIVSTARGKIRNTIDVSSLDANILKPINTKYNIELLFESVKALCERKTSSFVELRLNIEKGIPKELFGDSVKVKQIIMSILDNAFKYTSHGYVELRVHSIIKDNVCRLIITVEDTGMGMSIFDINEILNNHEELTPEEADNKDEMILNLKTIKKMINLIGGALMIESNENSGSKVTVIIDQMIVQEIKTNENKKIDDYQKQFNSIKNIAVISKDKNTSNLLNNVLKKYDIHYEIFDETLLVLNNVRENIKYDLIIIDENMEKIDGRSFFSKVKEVRDYKCKIMVITKSNDIRAKRDLIDFGFDGIIEMPIKKNDIKEIIEKLQESN